jgi:serine/threonine protein kinase
MDVIAEVRYDKIRKIGGIGIDGQNSEVFYAYDHYLKTKLVVKEIEKASIPDPARYFAEAQALDASAHPRVVPVRWAANRPDHICIAMPLMKGGSLAKLIERVPLTPKRLISVAQDLCEGVAHAHIAHIVHMDIKPTNVLFDEHGRAHITDFGQALPLDASGTADARGHRIYQPFTPPEIAQNKGGAAPACDVYQIGLTLFRAITGERNFKRQWDLIKIRPFPFSRNAIANGDFPDRVFPPFLPVNLKRAILKALDVNPANRQVGARALAEELGKVHIEHDWQPEVDEPDAGTWRLCMDGRADTLVLLRGALPDAQVEIYTEGTGGRRRKTPAAWANGLRTEPQLSKALSRAFRAAVV